MAPRSSSRNGEFTVNVALIDANEAVFGVVGVPVQQKIYVGDLNQSDPRGALMWTSMATTGVVWNGMTMQNHNVRVIAAATTAASDWRIPYRAGIPICRMSAPFCWSSLKLCVSGGADVYPRLGPTSEWDIGAAQAVLTAAGEGVYTPDGEVLAYNTKESL